MTRGNKIGCIVAGLLLLGSLPTLSGCYHAYHEKRKISIGMQAKDVFSSLDDWDLCLGSYLDENTHEFGMFNALKDPDAPIYRIPKYDQSFASKEEFVEFVQQKMNNGKAWNTQFTYFAGPIRNTFRTDFDANGKVINISGMVTKP